MINEHFNLLLKKAMLFAENQLRQYGSFYPFALSVDKKENVVMLSTYTGEENPEASKLIGELNQIIAHEAKSGDSIAAVLCCDVFLSKNGVKEDAIQCDLENLEGQSIKIQIPYIKKDSQGIEYKSQIIEDKVLQWFV